jgi:3alpha(or 20beta)-hydroxysteroid dehydrogenase
MGRLDGKVVIVTGGARGIGRATAEACAREGAAVVVGDVLEEEGRAAASAIREAEGRTLFVPTDVSQEAQCAHLVASAEREFGRVDALVNNAGIFRGRQVEVDQLDLATFESVLAVNVRGSFLMAKHAVPRLEKSRGVLVQIASGAGVLGGSASVAYGTSKGGAHGLALVLEQHLARRGIRVHSVLPGRLATHIVIGGLTEAAREQGRALEDLVVEHDLGDPAGVGRLIAFLVSDDADYVRGTVRTR